MWAFFALYFNWVFAAGIFGLLASRYRNTRGVLWIVAASLIQLSAAAMHWYEWQRLIGQPDRLYTWIVPMLLVIISLPCIVTGFVLVKHR